ncbi:pentapeptide repeat-containing protein [Leptolyngbya sp. NIES-3755]|nr:pentapeptide repeat-containing protein [Leptolyngbya sp. NIES-3755]
MNAQEIVELYATGQRDFSHVKLVHACLTEAKLVGAKLIGAELFERN